MQKLITKIQNYLYLRKLRKSDKQYQKSNTSRFDLKTEKFIKEEKK